MSTYLLPEKKNPIFCLLLSLHIWNPFLCSTVCDSFNSVDDPATVCISKPPTLIMCISWECINASTWEICKYHYYSLGTNKLCKYQSSYFKQFIMANVTVHFFDVCLIDLSTSVDQICFYSSLMHLSGWVLSDCWGINLNKKMIDHAEHYEADRLPALFIMVMVNLNLIQLYCAQFLKMNFRNHFWYSFFLFPYKCFHGTCYPNTVKKKKFCIVK